MEKIDFVVDWLDESDKEWQQEKKKYEEKLGLSSDEEMNSDNRYRDYGTFKYFFRAIEKYAPWVNKVYVVTNGQVPDFLDVNHPKIKLVKHSDYINQKYLPTFNSNVIETNYDKILDLSEQFVLFNDDVFLNAPVDPEEFFKDGLPTDYGIIKPQITFEDFFKIVFNDLVIINKHFSKKEMLKKGKGKFYTRKYGKFGLKNNLLSLPWKQITGFYDAHGPASLLKSTLKEVWRSEPQIMEATSAARFRSGEDINQWLFRYWQIAQGKFNPRNLNFEKLVDLKDLKKQKSLIENSEVKAICVNDITDNFEEDIELLHSLLEKKFAEKSSFEK